MAREKYRDQVLANEIQVVAKFETDPDLVEMRKPFPAKFFEVYEEGFRHYVSGNWGECRRIFETVEQVKGFADAPTKNLLEIMKESNYNAPSGWSGHREVTGI